MPKLALACRCAVVMLDVLCNRGPIVLDYDTVLVPEATFGVRYFIYYLESLLSRSRPTFPSVCMLQAYTTTQHA
jgi:hypothetical protein